MYPSSIITEINFTEKYISDNAGRKFMFAEHKRRGLMIEQISGIMPQYGSNRVFEIHI